jgi:hypothetical protein
VAQLKCEGHRTCFFGIGPRHELWKAPHLHCHGVRVMVAGQEVEQHVKRQSLPSIGLNSRASRAWSSTASRPSPMTCITPKHVRAEICRLPGGHTREPGKPGA